MSESNAEVARRGWEAAARGDFGVIESLLADDVKWHAGDPTAAGTCQNRSQALHWMQRARAREPLPELVDVREAGDRVVLILRPRPTGPPAAGATDASDEDAGGLLTANVTTFRDGKVVEMVHYPDAADALRTLGLDR